MIQIDQAIHDAIDKAEASRDAAAVTDAAVDEQIVAMQAATEELNRRNTLTVEAHQSATADATAALDQLKALLKIA